MVQGAVERNARAGRMQRQQRGSSSMDNKIIIKKEEILYLLTHEADCSGVIENSAKFRRCQNAQRNPVRSRQEQTPGSDSDSKRHHTVVDACGWAQRSGLHGNPVSC